MLGHSVTDVIAVGDTLSLPDHRCLVVRQGVVATWASHPDGDDALLDLAGAGQIVAGHEGDLCHIRHHALTPVRAQSRSWDDLPPPVLVDLLRDQLRWREAWSAALAHSHTEDQLLDLLRLIATRFGVPHARNLRIELPLTHTHLAAATGRTRPTVTRALQRLQRMRLVGVVGARSAPRYVVSESGDDSCVPRHRP